MLEMDLDLLKEYCKVNYFDDGENELYNAFESWFDGFTKGDIDMTVIAEKVVTMFKERIELAINN